MRYALKILSFGWKYIKRYRARLALGLFCSLLYALLNGGTVWVVRAFATNYASQKVASSVKVAGERFTFNANLISDVHTNGIPMLLVGSSDSGSFTNEIDLQLILSGRQTNVVLGYVPAGNNSPYAATIIASNLIAPTGTRAILNTRFRQFQHNLQAAIDPWIPHFDEPVTWRHYLLLLVIIPAFVALRGLMDYGGNYCLGWVGEYAVRDMRMDVMEKLSSLSLDFFTRSSTGDMLTRIIADTQNLLRSLRASAPDLIKESISAVFVFGYMVYIDWRLTLLVLVLIPACAVPIVILGRKARKATRESRATTVLQTSQIVELISGIRVIKAFGLEKAEMERFRKTSKQIVRADMKSVQAKESLGPIIEVLAMCAFSVVLLYFFVYVGSAKDIPSFIVGFFLFFQSIKKLSAVHITFEQAHISVDRLINILDEQPKVCDPAQPKPFTNFASKITLNNVGFGYLEKQVLSNADLEIPRGFKLGIAGESGSGKTTLVNLLFRFYDPTSGVVKIDGLDLREISVAGLRRQMALVSQDVVIFDQTVAENIAAGKLGATCAEVEAAARGAFAHDFIMQLPQGYDTRVGERGVTLSGGQRQRIAIARAFVRNAPILVLDEATASLDSKTEAEVQVAIDRLTENRTVICVAHRLSTLKDMDKVVVLSEGHIVEIGSFQELLEKKGVFATMAARQGIFASET